MACVVHDKYTDEVSNLAADLTRSNLPATLMPIRHIATHPDGIPKVQAV